MVVVNGMKINAICAASIHPAQKMTICCFVNLLSRNGATAEMITPGRLEQATNVPIKAILPTTSFK